MFSILILNTALWPPQVLLTLPEASRQDYFQLLADPLLMLEQLLMNLKVDWASTAVSTLHNLLPAQEAGITNQHIDALLAEYGRKALDFPYAPREWSRSGKCSSWTCVEPASNTASLVKFLVLGCPNFSICI